MSEEQKQPPVQEEKECTEQDDLFARTNEGEGYMQCDVHLRDSAKCKRVSPAPKEIGEWVKEFDKIWNVEKLDELNKGVRGAVPDFKAIKSFIRSQIATAYERGKKETLDAIQEKVEEKQFNSSCCPECAEDPIVYLDDILSIISKYKK